MSTNLAAYCQGFARSRESWPPLPLAEAPELAWWRQLIGASAEGLFAWRPVLRALEAALPQLQLPQVVGISVSELYKSMVLRGEAVDAGVLAVEGPAPCWHHPEALRLWVAPHPCGPMPVLQTPCWHDFVQLVRALAHRGEPVDLADGVHAQAISGLIHWGLIKQFGRQSRARLIVLHEAPYGSVGAEHVPGGLGQGEWLAASTKLRLEHELTHLATKCLLGEMRLNLLDELVADCMGMLAALGGFDAMLFGCCLGVSSDAGRWTTYTRELSSSDGRQALVLVMSRAHELNEWLNEYPWLCKPDQAMQRLQWLCRQRLDQPISRPPAIPH